MFAYLAMYVFVFGRNKCSLAGDHYYTLSGMWLKDYSIIKELYISTYDLIEYIIGVLAERKSNSGHYTILHQEAGRLMVNYNVKGLIFSQSNINCV